jgi:exonuclease SbcC
MTAHRYELQVSQQVATRGNNAGLDVQVRDEHTGTLRAPESLSGGERFLASLSLALGLAEVVTQRAGGITLDTLFVDEGFGALDAESMEQAMLVLDGLREHGRTVGLISHVPALLERITAQVVVTPSPGGWSQVQVIT